jgi:hypothetical protein
MTMKSFKRNALVPMVLAFFAATVHADGGEVSQPAAYPTEEVQVQTSTCDNNARDAALRHELARTDGDVDPVAPAAAPCDEQKT